MLSSWGRHPSSAGPRYLNSADCSAAGEEGSSWAVWDKISTRTGSLCFLLVRWIVSVPPCGRTTGSKQPTTGDTGVQRMGRAERGQCRRILGSVNQAEDTRRASFVSAP